MPKTESTERSGELQVVSFRVDDKEYAVEIEKIIEIIYYRAATPLPEAPAFIEGVVDLRGTVIPVLDLKKRLRMVPRGESPPNHILIVHFKDKMAGIVVDEVRQVIHVVEDQIQSPQKFMAGTDSKHLRGVCKVDDHLIFILSIDALLSDDEQAQLGAI
jgi:purine-binding chemotaxis protein CheW